MPRTSQRQSFFERLKAGLEEGIQFAQGKSNLRTTIVPAPPPQFRAHDVLRLRKRCGMSQRIFARALNVSTKTVQSWEQGSRRPSQAALRLLQVLQQRPGLLDEIVIRPRSTATVNE